MPRMSAGRKKLMGYLKREEVEYPPSLSQRVFGVYKQATVVGQTSHGRRTSYARTSEFAGRAAMRRPCIHDVSPKSRVAFVMWHNAFC